MNKRLLLSTVFVIGILVPSWAQVYCNAGPNQFGDSEIVSVQLTGDSYNISRTSTACGPKGLQDFTQTDSANVIIDSSFTLAVAFGTCGTSVPSTGQVWIDWNQNGIFEPSETIGSWTGTSNANGVTTPNLTVNDTVPTNALTGRTRMRVMLTYGGLLPLDPCNNSITWGSVEDYTIRVQPSGACINPPIVGKATSNLTRVCANGSISLGLDSVSYAYGPSQGYQWQYSQDSMVWTNVANATTVKFTTVVSASGWYKVLVTCGTSTVASTPIKINVVSSPLATGTYTINSAYISSGTNFTSFGDFVKTASCAGISGPITVDVVPNSNGYNEQIFIDSISGASATNLITINGGGARLFYIGGLNRGTLVLNGARYLKFKNLKIEGTGTINCYALEMRNNAQFLEFDSCEFKVVKLSTYTPVHAIVAANDPEKWWQEGLAAQNVTIKNSVIEGGQNGITLNGGVAPPFLAVNNLIENNIIRDFYNNGIEVENQENAIIRNNDINRAGWNTVTSFRGMILSGRMDGCQVIGNKIHSPVANNSTAAADIHGIWVTLTNPTGNPVLIANNAIYNLNMNGISKGIYLYSGNNIRCYHNTITIDRSTITNANATQRALEIAANSGTFDIKNNIFNINYNGAGTKYAIYITKVGPTYTIDYNHYFVNSTTSSNCNVGFFLSASYSTLAAWKTANNGAFEQNGVYGDPIFDTDFKTPRSAFGNSNGANLLAFVPKDLNNLNRSTTPDRGAIEYTPASCLAPSSISHLRFSGGVDINWVNSPGADSVKLEYGVCGFVPGTGTSLNVNGNTATLMGLLGNTCYTIYLQSYCGGATGIATFTNVNMLCGAASIPFFHNLSGSGGSQTSSVPPPCWTSIQTSSSALCYSYGTDVYGPKSQSRHWRMYNGANATDTLALVTPLIAGISTGNIQAKFWAKSNNTTPVRIFVGTMARPDDRSTILIIDTFYATQNYSEFTMYLNTALGYNGTDSYVVFMAGNTFTGQDIFLDDISFNVIANCHPPIGIKILNSTPTSATIGWTTITGTCFNLEYGPRGFLKGSGTTIQNVSSPTTLGNLTPNTPYDVYIADCCFATNWAGPIPFATACLSQLSGTYSINKNLPTGGTNFTSFQDFVDRLNGCGVSGAVTANVAPATGPYVEQITVGNVLGASTTNIIKINGNGNRLKYTSTVALEPATLTLDGAHNFEFYNLEIEGAGTTNTAAVQLINAAHNNTFDNCFILVNKNLTSLTVLAMVFGEKITNVHADASAFTNNTVKNCIIEGGYYCLAITGPSAGALSFGNVLENNEIRNFYQNGLFMRGQDNLLVKGNDFHRKNVVPQSAFFGIVLRGRLEDVKIIGNSVHDVAPIGTSSLMIVNLIQANNISGAATKPILIANNIFYNIDASECFGVTFEGTGTTVNFFHNTFTIDGSIGNAAYEQRILNLNTTSGAYNILNNILSCTYSGTGMKHLIYIGNTSPSFTINYNHYYMNAGGNATSNHVGYWNGNHTTLANWKTANNNAFEANGLVGDPQLMLRANANLTPFAAIGNNNAQNINTIVPNDYYNKPRSSTPDRGAIEFVPVSQDISISAASLKGGGICPSANDTVQITIKHIIGSTVNFATTPINVHWEVTGPVNSSGIINVNTGVLSPNTSIVLSRFLVNMTLAGDYNLRTYLDPNTVNQYAGNDTLLGQGFKIQSLFEASPKEETVYNGTDSVAISVRSRFLNTGDIFISEVCHFKTTTGAPLAGWPTWLKADDYIEITGAPSTDFGGYTLEQWQQTARVGTYTFPTGTNFSPLGTAIIAVGQMGNSVPNPAYYYYHGNGNFVGSFSSSDAVGRILKDRSGNIVDVVCYGSYTFPAAAGVTTQHWIGTAPLSTGTAGNRLNGADTNSATNWISVSAANPQDPNSLNNNVSLPNSAPTAGFSWSHNGVVIDTNSSIHVGPWPNPGTYKYVARLANSLCGPLYDTVTIHASFSTPCLAATNVLASNIDCDAATVSWVRTSGNTTSVIEFGVAGFTRGTGTFIKGVSSPQVLTALAPGVMYDVYVSDSCSSGISNPVKISFTTTQTPLPVLSPTHNTTVIFSHAVVAFNAGSNATNISWNFGDGGTGNGNATTHNYGINGTYTVVVTASNSCGSVSDTFIVVVAGISIAELNMAKMLSIFPNPNTGKFQISLMAANASEIQIQVISPVGQIVYRNTAAPIAGAFSQEVDLSHMAAGVYIVQISTDAGTIRQKVTIQK